jgi:hypothetical protein
MEVFYSSQFALLQILEEFANERLVFGLRQDL